MTLKITDDCIACGICVDECPNQAIFEDDMQFAINPDLCTECIVDYAEPQCKGVCPSQAIIVDNDHLESQETLKARRQKIKS